MPTNTELRAATGITNRVGARTDVAHGAVTNGRDPAAMPARSRLDGRLSRPARQRIHRSWWSSASGWVLRRHSLGLELTLVAAAYLAYEAVRRSTQAGASAAYGHATQIMQVEAALHIDVEAAAQSLFLSSPAAVTAANWFYGLAYALCTIGVLVWLFRCRPESYGRWRTSLGLLTFASLVGFALFPLMPPRLVDQYGASTGLVDTLAAFPTPWTFQSSVISTTANLYAAMPSVHCAWAIWAGAAVWSNTDRRGARASALAFPAVTLLVVLVTANHYVLDVVGAAVVFAFAEGCTHMARRAARTAQRPDELGEGGHPALPALLLGRPSGFPGAEHRRRQDVTGSG